MVNNKIASPKEVLAIGAPEEQEARPQSPTPPPPPAEPVKVEAAVTEPPDLLVILKIFLSSLYFAYYYLENPSVKLNLMCMY